MGENLNENITHLTNLLNPVQYLVVGHVTEDIVGDKSRIGGTATFSGLTALTLGLSVGVITSCRADFDISTLENTQVYRIPSETNTTFQNIKFGEERRQFLFNKAVKLNRDHIPDKWVDTPIVHLGPVADEIDPEIIKCFPKSLVCLTPQGWLRGVNLEKKVYPIPWTISPELTSKASIIILSTEDVKGEEDIILELASLCPLVVVTENSQGARVFWNGDVRHFSAPDVPLVEDTGAGDIFSAAYFIRYAEIKDPWESAKFAIKLASNSVTRKYLDSIPSRSDIQQALIDII